MKIFHSIFTIVLLLVVIRGNSIADILVSDLQICSIDIAYNDATAIHRDGKEIDLKKGEKTRTCFEKFDIVADAEIIQIEVDLHNSSHQAASRILVNYSVSYTVANRVQHKGPAFEFLDREATAKTAKFFGVLSSERKTIELEGNSIKKMTFQLGLRDLIKRLNKRNLFVTELSFIVSAEPPEAEMTSEVTLGNNTLEKKLSIPLPLD